MKELSKSTLMTLKFNKYKLLIFIGLLVHPILAILLLFICYKKLQKIGAFEILILVSSYALFLAYRPPFYDTIYNFYEIEFYDSAENPILSIFKGDFYTYLLLSLKRFFSIEYVTAIHLLTFVVFTILLSTVYKNINNGLFSNYTVLIILLTVLFSVGIRNYVAFNRFTIASLFVIISVITRSRIVSIIFTFLSFCFHPSVLFLYFLGAVLKYIRKNKRSMLMMLLISLISTELCIKLLLMFMPDSLFANMITLYTDADNVTWAQALSPEKMGLLNFIIRLFVYIFIICLYIYISFHYNLFNKHSSLCNLFLSSTLISICFYNFATISERFIIIAFISGVILLLFYYNHYQYFCVNNKRFVCNIPLFIFSVTCFFIFLEIVESRGMLTKGYEQIDKPEVTKSITYSFLNKTTIELLHIEKNGFSDKFFIYHTYPKSY